MVSLNAAANRQRDRRVIDMCDAGLRERRSVGDVRRKELHRVIWVDRAERVLAEANRQPRAPKRPQFARFARFARRGFPTPYIARSFAEGDEHAHRRDGFEHRERIALRLVERILLLFRARVDREARRGGREAILLVLRHGVVERRPDEHLQLRKVFFDHVQYALVLARGLWRGRGGGGGGGCKR